MFLRKTSACRVDAYLHEIFNLKVVHSIQFSLSIAVDVLFYC